MQLTQDLPTALYLFLSCSGCCLFNSATATIEGGTAAAGMFGTFLSVVQKENFAALWKGTSPVSYKLLGLVYKVCYLCIHCISSFCFDIIIIGVCFNCIPN